MTEFKVGDRVRVKGRNKWQGQVGTIEEARGNTSMRQVALDTGGRVCFWLDELTPADPTPAWAPTAGEWAAVRVHGFPASNPKLVEIERPGKGTSLVFADALHPLPPMAAEDAAVLRAADEIVEWWGKDSVFFCKEPDALLKAVRARAKPAQEAPMAEKQRWGAATAAAFSDQAQRIAAAEKAVAEAAMAWRRTLTVLPSTAYEGAFGVFVRATDAAIAATAPVDRVKELREAAENVIPVMENCDFDGFDSALGRLRAALGAMGVKS